MPDCFLPANSPQSAVPIHAVSEEELPARLAALGLAGEWAAATGFKAAAGTVSLVPDPFGGLAAVLVGLGKADEGDSERLLAGKLPTTLPAGVYRLGEGFGDAALASLAWALGAYRFQRYRKDPADPPPRLVLPSGVDGAEVGRIADGVYLARDLINTATNDLGPAELAAAAHDLADRHGATFSEIVGDDLLAEGFPLVHAVGAGAASERAPRLVDLAWGDPGHPKVTLVGKGVCFDTGGLDIKPAAGMRLMKKDMGGAANALALAHMIMDAGLPLRLRVVIPAVENAISGAAFRPGDVLASRKGLTVEIDNTDAEGRLILADALTLAAEDKPDLLVDFATLTGAARVALGPDVPAAFTADDGLAADLSRWAEAVADPVWRMPLWSPYMTMLDSKVADINNAADSPFAGSITAALFLSRFVPESIRWLHADIFAWTPAAKPGKPEGGEAQVIRALYGLLRERYAS